MGRKNGWRAGTRHGAGQESVGKAWVGGVLVFERRVGDVFHGLVWGQVVLVVEEGGVASIVQTVEVGLVASPGRGCKIGPVLVERCCLGR